jgi:hypothetical protein
MSKLHVAAFLVIPAALAIAGSFEYPETPDEPALTREASSQTLRVKLDLARGRRWELGWDGLFAYDIASGELARKVTLPGATFAGDRDSAYPDMILSRSGAVIVSSNIEPRLWRVSPARFEVEVYDVETGDDAEIDFGFTQLAWVADERILQAKATPIGSEWIIDLGTGTATRRRQ